MLYADLPVKAGRNQKVRVHLAKYIVFFSNDVVGPVLSGSDDDSLRPPIVLPLALKSPQDRTNLQAPVPTSIFLTIPNNSTSITNKIRVSRNVDS